MIVGDFINILFFGKISVRVLGTFLSADNEKSVRVVCCESVSNFLCPVRVAQVGVYTRVNT